MSKASHQSEEHSPRRSVAARVGALSSGVLTLLFDGGMAGLISVTGLIGVCGAMMSTSGSLFLANEVHAAPLMIGLFFAARGVLQIVSGLLVGALSDRVGRQHQLLALCAFVSALGSLAFAILRNYYLLFALGAVFLALGSACFAQLFAYSRRFAEERSLDTTFFNSVLRAVTSVTWIAGPPLGFLLIATHGFGVLYTVVTALYLVTGALCLWLLPELPDGATGERSGLASSFANVRASTWLLLSATVLLLTVNTMYQIDIALFVTKDLGLETGFTGLLLGLAATIEVPVIMFVGARAERIGKWRMLTWSAACATLFFAALPFAESKVALLLLQVPNAFWAAIVVSIPVTVLQDQMPDRVGAASSLFTSAFHTGMLVGGAITGAVTQWIGFTNVFWVCALLAALATALIALGNRRAASDLGDRRAASDDT